MEKKFIISTGIKGMEYWNKVEKQLKDIEKRKLGLIKKKQFFDVLLIMGDWCNGSALVLHIKSNGSIPLSPTNTGIV